MIRPMDARAHDPAPEIGAAADGEHVALAAVLRRLRLLADGDRPPTVADVVGAAGPGGAGVLLLLFALPEALPLPVAGVSAILAVPLALVSAQLAVGRTSVWLPRALLRRTLPAGLLRRTADAAAPWALRAERATRPRWPAAARARRTAGFAALLMSLVVALPIPLGNMAPSIVIAVLAVGLVQRDGVLVAAGVAGAALVLGALAIVAVLGWELLQALLAG
jgi:hypothetical protein